MSARNITHRVAKLVSVIALLFMLLLGGERTASAHIGSPDVFFEGDAGPYPLYVTVRSPDVIPGVATIEIRARSTDITGMTVVPLRLTGPGSELPPKPDRADRSSTDPQFFTASLWLMEHGSLQVRIHVDGARGDGTLAVPIPASAQRTLEMDSKLGTLLLALMLLLALSLVSIAGAAVREAGLDPGTPIPPPARRKSRIAIAVASVLVTGIIFGGHLWWKSDADDYRQMVMRPWKLQPHLDGCRLTIKAFESDLLPDHGHDMHLFMVRTQSLDRLAHLHPVRQSDRKQFAQMLPPLSAGHYKLFADIVFPSGFPYTGEGELDIPNDLSCDLPTGDDSAWYGMPQDVTAEIVAMPTDAPPTITAATPPEYSGVVFDRPPTIHAREPLTLHFRVVDSHGDPATDMEPYMAMAGHAAILADDLSVFAHIHPSGSVAMPALMLAKAPHAMYAEGHALPPEVSFPYGFPKPGKYHVFVQIKRAGIVRTGVFPVDVIAK